MKGVLFIMPKKVPVRMCLVCKELKPKETMFRIVKNKENIITIDNTGKMNGHGAYVCKKKSCLEKLIKSKKLDMVFKTAVNLEIYEILRMQMEDMEDID